MTSLGKFAIEKILEKKKSSRSESNCFCKGSNFSLPIELSFGEKNQTNDIFFDKILESNNFYIALDEPILPQVCGNYSINWSFRLKILQPNFLEWDINI